MFSKSFLKKVAALESIPASFLEKQLSRGRAVILGNKKRCLEKPVAIGEGIKVKINTNIGLSTTSDNISGEIRKLLAAIRYGADTIMDLSISGNSNAFRKMVLQKSSLPVGTVPIYEAALLAEQKNGSFEKMTFADIFDALQHQAEQGVDFFTIHAGILAKTLTMLKRKKRIGGIVSRGGAILSRWMHINKKENPLFENFDVILQLAKKYNITLSLGDALRPGAIADSTDALQIFELSVLGELVKRSRKKGVQVIVEGPGHIRIDEIPMNMRLEKKMCHHAPFYVLGPLPTDIAAGYDHITAAIGGAIAAYHGADFLCVVTPAEHLKHPTTEDVREGTISSRIAAHCVNTIRFKDEWEKDCRLSYYRAQRVWGKVFALTMDEMKARRYRESIQSSQDACSMCGDFCSLKIIQKSDLLH